MATQHASPVPVSRPPYTPSSYAPLFVYGVWILTCLLALTYVFTTARNIPLLDDWHMVAPAMGKDFDMLQGDYLRYFWRQEGNHRLPLMKAVLLSLYGLTNLDFRSGMYCYLTLLSAISLALIVAAGRLRGWTSYADAVFPLVVVWGDYYNFLWGWQIALALPVCLTGTLLIYSMICPSRLTLGAALGVGICLALLPLCGPLGMAYLPAFGLWYAYVACRSWRRSECGGRSSALVLWALLAVAFLLTVLNFQVDYVAPTPEAFPLSPDLWTSLATGAAFLSMAWGIAGMSLWPYTGFAILGLLLLSVVVACWTWYHRPADRLRVSGALAFFAGIGLLACAVGYGRGGVGVEAGGLTFHYVVVAAPSLWGVFLVLQFWGRQLGELCQMLLFTAMCLLAPLNLPEAYSKREQYVQKMDALIDDIRSEEPVPLLVQRYLPYLHAGWYDPTAWDVYQPMMAELFQMLRARGVEPFRDLHDEPERIRTMPLSLELAERNDLRWKSEVVESTGPDPYLKFTLARPTFVWAVRFRYVYEQSERSLQVLQVTWNGPEPPLREWDQSRLFGHAVPAEEKTFTVWIGQIIDEIRLVPGAAPCTVRFASIELLLKEED